MIKTKNFLLLYFVMILTDKNIGDSDKEIVRIQCGSYSNTCLNMSGFDNAHQLKFCLVWNSPHT